MKILITTGIYPPQIGGPAQYAKKLKEALVGEGHEVKVVTYGIEKKLPTGIRHLFFFFKVLPKFPASNFCITLDTFSVGFPSVAAGVLFNKKVVIRTGGDFLWEKYLERTKEKILLREFYESPAFGKLSIKEKNIFVMTKWTVKHAKALIFSTDWQKKIWAKPYNLDSSKISVIENYYGTKLSSNEPTKKDFIGSSRPIQFKNLDTLKNVFEDSKLSDSGVILDLEGVNHEKFLEKLKNCYASILISLGDISPNFIMDTIRFNKPFILTTENGITERIKDIALFVDPLNQNEIKEKINYLLNPENYKNQVEKIRNFSFVHSWEEIAKEFVNIYEKI